jgi:hypothetical protein
MVKITKLIHFFKGFYAFFHPVLDSDPDPDPKPRVPDPDPTKSSGSMRIRIHNTGKHECALAAGANQIDLFEAKKMKMIGIGKKHQKFTINQ